MKQAVWTGAVSFGLVNIPVKLYPATDPKDVRFHLYDRQSGKRVRYERVIRAEDPTIFVPEPGPLEGDLERAPAEDRSIRSPLDAPVEPSPFVDRGVGRADVVRGFQMPTGDLVTVSDEEFQSIAPSRSRTIEIEEFVDLAQIDPVFFDAG